MGFFPPKDEIPHVSDGQCFDDKIERSLPVGPQHTIGSGGFISHAQDFALHNPTMTSVQGNQYMVTGNYHTVTYAQGDRTIVPQSG